mmetsp:Transcript_13020/g.40092  ORF Transcript_13020/g.40092 Transcript_13020/m.40092 type:complete len:1217 (+) Transcript_13020:244-3894(+)|eukprot:CAMPEP_0198729680 /NCGR_PEP_ID=MMETSP1475-20131203/20518_1 /TAXON_ID= ORGANISM="Unidentified sp., Strain CCMP1999" /NCGR_SAMPLE_ID=MMETSP1475 /ASSEMBLY_ACC=CAM_ASM_001111 /LENGTH=1216 /DNA_ID=CAMNT_0044492381 /DNA_START=139 /DNA_END=3789 /DNA_ORIENTATION=+
MTDLMKLQGGEVDHDSNTVPEWVPKSGAGVPADVYPVIEKKEQGEEPSVELVLNSVSVKKDGHAERRRVWEFNSCIHDGLSSAASSGGNNVNLAAYINPETVLQIRANVTNMRRQNSPREQRIVIAQEDIGPSMVTQPFPLQKPRVAIAFDAFLTKLASNPSRLISDDVPLGQPIARSVGRTLEMLLEKAVPTQRAVWFIRVAVLNDCPKQARPDKPAPAPRILWLKLVSDFVRSEVDHFRLADIPPEAVEAKSALWDYLLSVLRWQADEGLLDELGFVTRTFFVEFKKEVASCIQPEESGPRGSLAYRQKLFSMLLSATERFEPELLAYLEYAQALSELLMSILKTESVVTRPFLSRVHQLLLRVTRRLYEVEHFSMFDSPLKDNRKLLQWAEHASKQKREANGPVADEAEGLDRSSPPRVALAEILTSFPYSGDTAEVLNCLSSAFRTSASAVRFVVRWALLGPGRHSPLTHVTAATIIKAVQTSKTDPDDKNVHLSPTFQRPIFLEVERCANRKTSALVTCDAETSAELLFNVHAAGAFSLVLYLREVRTLLSRGEPNGNFHLDIVQSLPETSDRSATLQKRTLVKRWRGQKQAVVPTSMEILSQGSGEHKASARRAGEKLRKEHGFCSRLTHCEIIARSPCTSISSVLVFLVAADGLRSAVWLIRRKLANLTEENDDKDVVEALTNLPRLAPALTASGCLSDVVNALVLLFNISPQVTESCAASLAGLFWTTSPLFRRCVERVSRSGAPAAIVSALRGRPLHPQTAVLGACESYLSGQVDSDVLADSVPDSNGLVQVLLQRLKANPPRQLPDLAHVRFLSAGLSPTASIELVKLLASRNMDGIEELVLRSPIASALLAAGDDLVRCFAIKHPKLLSLLLCCPSEFDRPHQVAITECANEMNGAYVKKWLEFVRQHGSTDSDSELAETIFSKLKSDCSQRNVMYSIAFLRDQDNRLLLQLISTATTQLAVCCSPVVCATQDIASDPITRSKVVGDQVYADLLLKIPVHLYGAENQEKLRESIVSQLLSIVEMMKDVSQEEKIGRLYLGEAVIRRVRLLRHVGIMHESFSAAQVLLDLLEAVIPALDERFVDDVLDAMRVAADAAGKGRDKLKKRVVTSSVHFWLSPRQRMAFCAFFAVGRGMNGVFRRGVVAFAPSDDSSTGRKVIDNWTLLEGQSPETSAVDVGAFGVQVGGDFKPTVRLKRTFATFSCLAR